MMKYGIVKPGLLMLALILCGGVHAQSIKLRTLTDSLSYALGVDAGTQFKSAPMDIDAKALAAGMQDALSDKTGDMSTEAAHAFLSDFFSRRLPEIQKQKSMAYLQEIEETHPNIQKTERGLLYEIVEPGVKVDPEGPFKVSVHYFGELSDGTRFDSSYDRGEPLVIDINHVIDGWTEGLKLIGVGGKIRLWVPYFLGYGERGTGPIPPYETLFFEVEMLEVIQE